MKILKVGPQIIGLILLFFIQISKTKNTKVKTQTSIAHRMMLNLYIFHFISNYRSSFDAL